MTALLRKFLRIIPLAGLLIFSGSAKAEDAGPLYVNRIVAHPFHPESLFAAARPQGVLRSADGGRTWRPAREGLTNPSGYHLAIHPAAPQILYLGTFGGGVFRTDDGGRRWREVNRDLGNTNIHALAIHPARPEEVVVSTSTGELYRTGDGGKQWHPYNEGLPVFEGEVIASLLALSENGSNGYLLAQGGLYRRSFSSAAWERFETGLEDRVITALSYDSRNSWLYIGTMKNGLFKAELRGSPLLGPPRIRAEPVPGPFASAWIRLIQPDPRNPAVLYVAPAGRGIFKSADGGASWREANAGLADRDVLSLAIDPLRPKRLYAGGESRGIFLSNDGGATWRPPERLEADPPDRVVASLDAPPAGGRPDDGPSVPAAFAKCNRCHGWTDPRLNRNASYFRVAANARPWGPTVRRMAPGAGLSPEETAELIRFLDEYTASSGEAAGR